MAMIFSGSRDWDDVITPLDDDWRAYKEAQRRKNDPMDIDYIPEEYRVEED